ncbi:hypothetical protein EYV94_14100 [Puteibacter caeruleilacunae]|nr:hypothetical protein EYV94_14100 [Puteibacter caeruleilacunae]
MKIIDTYQHTSQGYDPYLITNQWQVAQLNHAPEEELNSINCLDIHYKTDEVFFLIEGTAVLIAAQIKDDTITYDLQLMKPGITYNIRKNIWHKIAMQPNAKVLIIENSNTHIDDYEFYYLSQNQIEDLRTEVNQLITK